MAEPTPLGLARNERDNDPTGKALVAEIAKGWLSEYVEYASAQTDSPVVFHLAVGLSQLATACGSRVVFSGAGGRTYWPNLYVLFIAPSGISRKTTSINMGTDLLRMASPECICPNETSREEFLRLLSNNPEMLIRESEFASALARYSRDYMGGFKELITDLYDNTPEYRRQIKGRDGSGEKLIIRKPALNYLAASTLEWLIDSLTVNDMRSGFLARFLIFPALGKGNWVSFLAQADDGDRSRLSKVLADICRLPGATVDFRSINKPFNNWAKQMESAAETAQPDVVGFYSRVVMHCAKICALLTISDQGARTNYAVSEEVFGRACHLMEWLRDRYEDLAERKLIFSKEERQMQGIMETVRKDGKIEWSLALKRAHMKTTDFQRYLQTLIDRKEVYVVTEQTRTKPARMIALPHTNGKVEGKLVDMPTMYRPKSVEPL